MSLDPKANFAICTVSSGYAAGATSIVLQTGDGAKLPAPSSDGEFNLVWFNAAYSSPSADPLAEIVRVTARTGDTLTITRAQEGTTDNAHNTAGATYRMILGITAKDFSDINEALTTGGGQAVYADTGTANALAITTGLGLSALADGMRFRVRVAYANTSGAPTLEVDSCGPKPVANGGDMENLTIGAGYTSLKADRCYDFVYDSTIAGGVFLVNSPTLGWVAPVVQGQALVCSDASAAANTILLTRVIGSNIAEAAGQQIVFIPSFTNTGACTVKIGSGSTVYLYGPDGTDLMPGVLIAGAPTVIAFDGTNWRLVAGGSRNNCIRYGELYIQANATATTISVAGTFYNTAGTWTAGTSQTEPDGTATFTKSTTGGIDSLLYNGPSGRIFRAAITLCMESGTSNQDLAAKIGVNGTPVDKSGIHTRFGIASTDHVTACCVAILALNNGDKVTLMVTNESGANSVTVDHSSITITEV